ncbi:probable galacturonosyltransferase 7 isoform X2 [Tripterygium wilfordii]|uniref:probable galacturonosyltransferase 7 isoform X2 n=1 Tax=Tripterygium wilfordii TaxID=458696 RepID=UPI0018F7F1FF|nr:probable galacturonosyltransferase 7 isoform X2 [Tripterygium wilfordii]
MSITSISDPDLRLYRSRSGPVVELQRCKPICLHTDCSKPVAYPYDQPSSTTNVLIDNSHDSKEKHESPVNETRVKEILDKIPPILPQGLWNRSNEPLNETIDTAPSGTSTGKKGSSTADVVQQLPTDTNDAKTGTDPANAYGRGGVDEYGKGGVDENINSCEVSFGTYCLWRGKNREETNGEMNASMVKKLKDRLFVARAYYPSIAKLPAQNKLSRELKQNIQELERVLSESSTDAVLQPGIEKKLRKMEAAIARAKSCPVDCGNVDKKLRQILDLTLDEATFHMKQSIFLYQLAVRTMPKGLHCLSMNQTVEYFKSPLKDMELSLAGKYSDPTLQHYVVFSKNVLASSVVINSTVTHARESGNLVFHVLTDQQNYFAMKLWFFRNMYKDAAVQVLNIEHLNMDSHAEATDIKMSMPREFRVSFSSVDNQPSKNIRTEYITTFSPSHYLLPEIFKSLEKVLVLNDDVVVQQDLSSLWNLNMGGKVNGAVQFCSVRLGLLKSYLGENNADENACVWMSGLNIIDLARWRELDLTKIYWRFVQEVKLREKSVGDHELAANLLTFQDTVYALDDWALSGLGHDFWIDVRDIENAAVLHYNGDMKPWLNMGIPKYKTYWNKFLNREDEFLLACNVNA